MNLIPGREGVPLPTAYLFRPLIFGVPDTTVIGVNIAHSDNLPEKNLIFCPIFGDNRMMVRRPESKKAPPFHGRMRALPDNRARSTNNGLSIPAE